MRFPVPLRQSIEAIAGEVEPRALARASSELSARYREGAPSNIALPSPAHRAAYLALRMPATFAATGRVFEEVCRLSPDLAIHSMLDFGAGPGTAMWAASEIFPELARAVLLDRDPALLELGRRLTREAIHPAIASAEWQRADLSSTAAIPQTAKFDLVVISYVLGELNATAQTKLVHLAWSHTEQLVVIIEPGTPRGFESVLAARATLTASGARILAPCPRSEQHPCPMAEAGDWCHFSQRLERTSQHRRLKSGALGYEDEKFSYVVVSRQQTVPASTRILRHPLQQKGHVKMQLCTPDGLHQITVTKSDKERYRAARRAEWGDAWAIS